jgi:hypothetical protein
MKSFQSKKLILHCKFILLTAIAFFFSLAKPMAQESAKEEDFFKINKVHAPEGSVIEVGGLCTLPDGNLA